MRVETNLVVLLPVCYWAVNIFLDNFTYAGDIISHGSGWFQGLFFVMLWLPDLNFEGGWKSKTYKNCLYYSALVFLIGGNFFKLLVYKFATTPM